MPRSIGRTSTMTIAGPELANTSRPSSSPGTGGAAPDVDAGRRSSHSPLPAPTREEWHAAGLSLLFHVILLLVLAALLMPAEKISRGSGLVSGIGVDGDGGDGGGEMFETVAIAESKYGNADQLEKALSAVDGVPAVQGALEGGLGSGSGRYDGIGALTSGGGGTGKGIGFFGTRARANSVVFVVDMSGSMNEGRRRDGPTRFQRAVDELTRSLNALDLSQKFFVIFYNGQTHPFPLAEQRTGDKRVPEPTDVTTSYKLLPATTAIRSKAAAWIKSLHPEGDTFPEDALEHALRLRPDVIFFLTDGEIPDTVRETVRKANREHKTVIHTIAFEYQGGAEMLRGIAIDNRGRYRFVP